MPTLLPQQQITRPGYRLAGAPVRADVFDLAETDASVRVNEDHAALLSNERVDPDGQSCDSDFPQTRSRRVTVRTWEGSAERSALFSFTAVSASATVTLPHQQAPTFLPFHRGLGNHVLPPARVTVKALVTALEREYCPTLKLCRRS